MGTVEDLARQGEAFDAALAMEVVEHVADVRAFVAAAASLVKPGGLLALSTLNRTLKSFALAIVGAEYALRWLAPGTHRWEQFVTPDELAAALRAAGLRETRAARPELRSAPRRMAAVARSGGELSDGGEEGVGATDGRADLAASASAE